MPDTKPLSVVESLSVNFSYHLAPTNRAWRSYCDIPTMATHMTLDQWGNKTHLNERYCSKCAELVGFTTATPNV